MDHKNLELAIQLRRELHQHPELSNQEVWTKQHLIDFLKATTKLEIVDRGRWFYAIYRAGEDRENIAFRADFDAIKMKEGIELPYGSLFPGISHKCGHDGHAASLAAFALEVAQNGSDKNIFFLFQHAEETGDGAAECKVFIRENGIKEIFAYHNMSGMPLKSVNIIDGTTNCASKGMVIHMEGKPSHASEPEKGVNPAFAIARIIDAIPGFIAPEKNKGMVLCTVIQVDVGEKAFGVNASKGELLLTIRALYEAEMDQLQKNLENLATSLAEAQDLTVSFSYQDYFPETFNHKVSADKIREAAQNKGFEVVEMKEAFRGSEDFGHYLKETKGAICYIGNGVDYPNVHSHKYDFNDEIIETAVELFKELAAM
ncbi:M20 metallopeptidase family protein [Acidaminobacter hydrogenoformans]|uniref:Amidohydrolase n=1 Tax=Acidaminobacter hydrogenoformans DSM 2784 TaxID=1120920 RepID=A0A1G5RQ80_9FIRM|nr:amidohydrolase [Acidaminobacter hydrogenoformans]SCZ76018.1 amidohydrolase [Acidaminobacter hydrogenoformans DSM 2784]